MENADNGHNAHESDETDATATSLQPDSPTGSPTHTSSSDDWDFPAQESNEMLSLSSLSDADRQDRASSEDWDFSPSSQNNTAEGTRATTPVTVNNDILTDDTNERNDCSEVNATDLPKDEANVSDPITSGRTELFPEYENVGERSVPEPILALDQSPSSGSETEIIKSPNNDHQMDTHNKSLVSESMRAGEVLLTEDKTSMEPTLVDAQPVCEITTEVPIREKQADNDVSDHRTDLNDSSPLRTLPGEVENAADVTHHEGLPCETLPRTCSPIDSFDTDCVPPDNTAAEPFLEDAAAHVEQEDVPPAPTAPIGAEQRHECAFCTFTTIKAEALREHLVTHKPMRAAVRDTRNKSSDKPVIEGIQSDVNSEKHAPLQEAARSVQSIPPTASTSPIVHGTSVPEFQVCKVSHRINEAKDATDDRVPTPESKYTTFDVAEEGARQPVVKFASSAGPFVPFTESPTSELNKVSESSSSKRKRVRTTPGEKDKESKPAQRLSGKSSSDININQTRRDFKRPRFEQTSAQDSQIVEDPSTSNVEVSRGATRRSGRVKELAIQAAAKAAIQNDSNSHSKALYPPDEGSVEFVESMEAYREKQRVETQRDTHMAMNPCDWSNTDSKPEEEETEEFMNLREVRAFIHSDSGKPYKKCPYCPFEARREDTMGSHLVFHQPEDEPRKYQCTDCNWSAYTQSAMALHLKVHVNQPPPHTIEAPKNQKQRFSCSKCSFSTFEEDKLIKHGMDHRNKLRSRMRADLRMPPTNEYKRPKLAHLKLAKPPKTQLQCPMCTFVTGSHNDMVGHHDRHGWNQLYTCYRCDYSDNDKVVVDFHEVHHHENHDLSVLHQIQRFRKEQKMSKSLPTKSDAPETMEFSEPSTPHEDREE